MKDPGAGFGGFVIALPPGSRFLNSKLQIQLRILIIFQRFEARLGKVSLDSVRALKRCVKAFNF